jgi:hypothetical protein
LRPLQSKFLVWRHIYRYEIIIYTCKYDIIMYTYSDIQSPLHDINYRSGKNVRVSFNITEQWKEYTAVRLRWHAQKPDIVFCEMVSPIILVGVTVQSTGSWGCVCVHVCVCVWLGGPGWTGDVPQSWGAYWITTPFSSFPSTIPPMCRCVASHTNWPLHMHMIPEMLFFWFAALLSLRL